MRAVTGALDRATLRDIALVCVADAIVAIGFGALAVSGGLEPWVPIAMSIVVFAGGAQFAAVGVVIAGGGLAAAVATGVILNARLAPFGFAVAELVDGRWWRRLIGAHLITDESVAFALGQQDRAAKRAAFWISGLSLFVVWNLSVVAGVALGRAIGDTDVLGLDAAFPAVLLALVMPALRDRPVRNAAIAGAVVALAAAPVLPAGLPVLAALVGVPLAAWFETRRARGRAE